MVSYEESSQSGEISSEMMVYEYDIRMINNELMDIMGRVHLELDDLVRIDELQSKKAKLALEAHSRAYPTATASVRAMAAVVADEEDDDIQMEHLRTVLADLLEDRAQTPAENSERLEEINSLVDLINKILVAHITEKRTKAALMDILQ